MYWTNFHNIDESKMKNISISNLTQIYYIIKIKYSKQLSTVKCLQTYCNFSFLFLFLHKCIMVLFLFFFISISKLSKFVRLIIILIEMKKKKKRRWKKKNLCMYRKLYPPKRIQFHFLFYFFLFRNDIKYNFCFLHV